MDFPSRPSFFFLKAQMPRNSSNSGFLALNMNNILLRGTQKKLGAQLGRSLSPQLDGYILWPSLACFITIAVGFWSELGFFASLCCVNNIWCAALVQDRLCLSPKRYFFRFEQNIFWTRRESANLWKHQLFACVFWQSFAITFRLRVFVFFAHAS